MTSPAARQLAHELRVAQRARQAKHLSGDELFVDEVGSIEKQLAEQQDMDVDPTNAQMRIVPEKRV